MAKSAKPRRRKAVETVTIPSSSILIRGFSLESLGLKGAQVVHADGKREPLEGFLAGTGRTLFDSLMESIPEGATVEPAAQADAPITR